MEKNEVLWDFLADKLRHLSSSGTSGQAASKEETSSSSTYEAYEAALKEFAERIKSTDDELRTVKEYITDFVRSIAVPSEGDASSAPAMTVKEAIFALCGKCDDVFLFNDDNYLLFVDLVQILFASSLFDKNKKLFFNSLETVFYYMHKYVGQVIGASSFLNKPDEAAGHCCDEGAHCHHASESRKKRKLTENESEELVRLMKLLTRVIGLVEFLFNRQLSIEQTDTDCPPESFNLRPLLSSFLFNLYYEPLLFIDNNDDHDPDDHTGNQLFDQVISLIKTTCLLLMKINNCYDIVKLVVGQFESLRRPKATSQPVEDEQEKHIQREWTTNARYQLKGAAVSSFLYLLLKMNHFQINTSDTHLYFAFPEIYSFDYLFKNLYAPCLKHLFEPKSGLDDDHMIRNQSQVNNVLEFLNQIIIVESAHEHHEHDHHGPCNHHHHHEPRPIPTLAVTIDNQVELDSLIGIFEKLFGLAVYDIHASVRQNVYHLVNNLFTLKLDPKLKNSLITCYLFKTCRSSNGSGLSLEYLKLVDSTSSTPKKLFDEESQQHLYTNDAFNTYLASFMIYQFKEHFNKEFQTVIKNEPTDHLIYLEKQSGPGAGYKLTGEFMRPFNLIFDANYLRIDLDSFVNEYLLKSETLIKQESKFVAQLNLLRYLFILLGSEKLRGTVDSKLLRDSLASTGYLKYVESGLEKVRLNLELEKADLGRQKTRPAKPSKLEFNVRGLGEPKPAEDEVKMKLQTVESSLRSVDLMQSLKSRINELLEAI